jgi:hypothetical protein
MQANTNQRLLLSLDCTQEYGADRYFSCGTSRVVEGAAGRYREAEAKPPSRFGYRFRIEHVGRPHLAVIRYPDDRRRFMTVNDGTTYDLSTGITTGHAYPLSNTMQEIHQVFWPRWEDCSLCFMTWGFSEPAAVAAIEIYELDDLPELPSDGFQGRQFGIQYEDPCGIGGAEGAMNYAEWLDRVVTYTKHTGQRLLSYPICWYHGPIFPSEREPSDVFHWVAAKDRKLYNPWTTEPPDWPAVLLERFGREGLEFQGVLTLLRLGSLMKRMNIDLPAIQSGADTINNLLSCDKVQEGANDWTVSYNALNYPALVKLGSGKLDPWAYGEKHGMSYRAGPIFNPLHPVVQEAVVGFVAEIGRRYGKYPAFKGIAITMWSPTIIWFGSLDAGYDDTTAALFEKETGVTIPVDAKVPDRFSRRHAFLTSDSQQAQWVDWRCRKVRDLVRRLRDALTAGRPDLTLTLNLWNEVPASQRYGNGHPGAQIYARPNGKTMYREGGLDMDLYADEPNIRLDWQFEGGGRDRTGPYIPEEGSPMEWHFMFRDHDFLDRETLAAVQAQHTPGAFIFNAWHEAWGDHKWFACEPDDPNLVAVSDLYGKPAEGIFRMNSTYPADGFWWDSQLRITHAFPPAPHFMEQYAHAVAEVDACRITRGGLFLDKAHSEELRQFAAVYRKLPAEKFETVGATTDPVAVRTLVCASNQDQGKSRGGEQKFAKDAKGGRRYIYLVNREYYPIEVSVTLNRGGGIKDVADGTTQQVSERWTLELRPYELRAFTTDPAVEVLGFAVAIPTAMEDLLNRETRAALAAMAAATTAGTRIIGLDRVEAELRQCLTVRKFSHLRHLLTSYPVMKSLAVAGKS